MSPVAAHARCYSVSFEYLRRRVASSDLRVCIPAPTYVLQGLSSGAVRGDSIHSTLLPCPWHIRAERLGPRARRHRHGASRPAFIYVHRAPSSALRGRTHVRFSRAAAVPGAPAARRLWPLQQVAPAAVHEPAFFSVRRPARLTACGHTLPLWSVRGRLSSGIVGFCVVLSEY